MTDQQRELEAANQPARYLVDLGKEAAEVSGPLHELESYSHAESLAFDLLIALFRANYHGIDLDHEVEKLLARMR